MQKIKKQGQHQKEEHSTNSILKSLKENSIYIYPKILQFIKPTNASNYCTQIFEQDFFITQ